MTYSITIEGVSDALFEAYQRAELMRSEGGKGALTWAMGHGDDSFAVARQDGQIVGMSAYITNRFAFERHVGRAAQAVDSFVDDRLRGQGVFTALARAYEEHAVHAGIDMVWGFPNDNAAPVWFQKMGWRKHGQVPFLVKPLRAGYFLKKLGLPLDFPVSRAADQHLPAEAHAGAWAERAWEIVADTVMCGAIRDQEHLAHRLFGAPQAQDYRVVASDAPTSAAFVATRETTKHGGRIGYLLDAFGGADLRGLLNSEIGRMRARGMDAVLAWAYPWSPSYSTLLRAGFVPLPAPLRPIKIWFGAKPITPRAAPATHLQNWYLSYLDSDTI